MDFNQDGKGQLIVLNKHLSSDEIYEAAFNENHRDWELKPYPFDKQKIVFYGGEELIPVDDKGWKLILTDGSEVDLQKGGNWIVKIYARFDIFVTTLPYRNIEEGDVVIICVPHRVKQRVYVYDIEKNKMIYYSMKEMDAALHKILKERHKIRKREDAHSAYISKLEKRGARDDGDDEENIMRGLGSGNGDLFGF